jgi:hypothetical protein
LIRTIRVTFLIALCLLSIIATALAQDFRATVTGRVTDANRAAIPNASVQVKNIGTNEVSTATTNSEGNYRVPFLRPGAYSITVEANGFKKSTRDNIELLFPKLRLLISRWKPATSATA